MVKVRLYPRNVAFAAIALFCTASTAYAQTAQSNGDGDIESVIVTATRQAEVLSKVPASVTAITNAQMQDRGIKEFADTIKFTPGIQLNGDSDSGNTISIRGISSSAGASTTGIYLDDVPLQVRQVGYSAGALFPQLFDMDRVEVLRGPQGTLFGAGSEGGTVRFIQPQPSFDASSGHALLETNTIEHGTMGYEGGVAYGGPIGDKWAYRISANFIHTGGWIDRLEGTTTVNDPTGAMGVDSWTFNPTKMYEADSNWRDAAGFRAALAFRPISNLTITASLNYFYTHDHDDVTTLWAATSDGSSGEFATPVFLPPSSPDGFHTPINAPVLNSGHNNMFVPYLNVDWTNDAFEVISTTSYLKHAHLTWNDPTIYYGTGYYIWDGPQPGDHGLDRFSDESDNYTEEVRVQSADADARFHWLAGIFYSHNKQVSFEQEGVNFIQNAPSIYFVSAADDPFPGTTAFLNAFGVPTTLPNSVTYVQTQNAIEQQLAGFAQIDYKILSDVTLTVGGRYSEDRLNISTVQNGAENNLNAPYGSPCTTVGGCIPGQGDWAPAYVNDSLKNTERTFTPKYGVQWQINDSDMVYATVSKGFRPGGALPRVPPVCNPDLVALGFTDSSGNAVSPTSYGPDTVWSYELGSKDSFFNNHLAVAGSIYRIDWNSIQTELDLPNCGYHITANLGKAESKGFDLQFSARPFEGFTFSGAFGWNNTSFTSIPAPYSKGDAVPGGTPPWTVALSAEYDMSIGDYDPYIRADYTFSSRPRLTGSYLPSFPTYDPYNTPPPERTTVNMRTGVRYREWELALFVNNLLDDHKPYSIDNLPDSGFYSTSYPVPRTIGLDLTTAF